MAELDIDRLERQVKSVYRDVAATPEDEFHFEMGRGLAKSLGYTDEDLQYVPDGAVDSFAGVGYHFDLADIQPRERVRNGLFCCRHVHCRKRIGDWRRHHRRTN